MKYIKTFESFVNESDKDTLAELNEMTLGQLERIEDYAEMISDRMKQGQQLESWMFSEITQALNGLNSVHDAMDGIDGVKESEVNEGIRLDKTDKLLNKMTINDFGGDKWELNFIESDNEINPNSPDLGKEVYITITGKHARNTTSDSIMIPKEQWEEFKKMINIIKEKLKKLENQV